MKKGVFSPTDILLPNDSAMPEWSVIACDQFSSERGYWERVRDRVGGRPSAFNMIIPEAYLGELNEEEATAKISAVMDEYIENGHLSAIEDSLVYVERTLCSGKIRRGLVGALDLEQYSFTGGLAAAIASEGTIMDRLPARIRVRGKAKLELPHIMALIDDKKASVIEPLAQIAGELPLLYDFELMEGGGHITGRRITGEVTLKALAAMENLRDGSGAFIIIGDGNHSLAAAKVYWDEIKQNLSEKEKEEHPARKALVEINNVYDPAVNFEAIHRLVFGADPEELICGLENAMPKGSDYKLSWSANGKNGVINVSADCIGDMLAAFQSYLDDYANRTGCRIDYIHGEEEALALSHGDRCTALILPAMGKSDFFDTVMKRGVFPKKSFSIGHARDKRYYLECRLIK